MTKKFTSNAEENIIIYDLAGNKISDTIKINNIDKKEPKIKVTYSTTSSTAKDVVVTIISDKVIRSVDGWVLSSNMRQLTKTFKENCKEEIIITDKAGNSIITNINVENINDKNSEDSSNNTSILKRILLFIESKSIFIFIGIFVVVSIILGIKLQKNKNIK